MTEATDANFQRLYRRLVVADVSRQIPSSESKHDFTPKELAVLLGAASQLGLERNEPESQNLAYEIASRAARVFGEEYPRVIAIAGFLMSRIGNFPARDLVKRLWPDLAGDLGLTLQLEERARLAENTVNITSDQPVTLTDFQLDLLQAVEEWSTVSVSAPTSAGKSFVLTLAIVQKLLRSPTAHIAYVVPTRALIRQVMRDVLVQLANAGLAETPVRCVPVPISEDDAESGAVYVLTQERLLSLLYSPHGEARVTDLFIDEAQGIGEGSRGIYLQTAIETALSRSVISNVCFASPLTRNPDYLLDLFHRRSRASSLVERHSPVSQNLILVSQARAGAPRQLRYQLLADEARVDLGVHDVGFSINTSASLRRASFAATVTSDSDSTIVYENRPADTRRTASKLMELLPERQDLDPETAELCDFLSEFVHPDYELIPMLKHDVAIHFANMPPIVRAKVADLAGQQKVRFVCCTSTLLQGVNLPARHIVIENPKRGNAQPMNRRDFLNLAGRAGRLLKEFHGNVWCLRPEQWDEASFEGDGLSEIRSTFADEIQSGGLEVRRFLDDGSSGPGGVGEAALGKIFSDYTLADRRLSDSEFANDQNRAGLSEIDEICKTIPTPLPKDLYRKNASCHPVHLNRLYDFLASSDLDTWSPLSPYAEGFYDRLCEIVELLRAIFELHYTPKQIKFFCFIASQWIHDTSLRRIIDDRIEYMAENDMAGHDSPNDVICDLVKIIETDVRFEFVRLLRAYHDVLLHVLSATGRSEDASTLTAHPLYLYLECGTASPIVLNLLSLGVSRTTALLLKDQISFVEEPTPESCLAVLASTRLDRLKLPNVSKNEIRDLLRGRSNQNASE